MKSKWVLLASILAVLILALAAGLSRAQGPGPQGGGVYPPMLPLGTAFTYQGQLKKDGQPVNATCAFRFRLWDAETGGNLLGEEAMTLPVNNGLFTTQLDFGHWIEIAYWLEIAVQCPGDSDYISLTPRQRLTPAPYALALPGLWTRENITSTNIIGGYSGNIVAPTVVGATISGGGSYESVCGPGNNEPCINRVTDNYGTVGGGRYNQAGNNNNTPTDMPYATVGGGWRNTASGESSTVGGGYANTASGSWATVGGGTWNTAEGWYATVGGGWNNRADGTAATVGGGDDNIASDFATVGGGESNTTKGWYATVGGGRYNQAHADYATIAGGGPSNPANPTNTNNRVTDNYGTIGGGGSNVAGNSDNDTTNAAFATVGGGWGNAATSGAATVGGGRFNTASQDYATVSGGRGNVARGFAATVGGGALSTASGQAATVSGGYGNEASGDYATIPGGYGARASHYGEMAYASGYFSTTGDAQTSVYVLRNTSTGSSWTNLYLDGSSGYLTIAPNRALTFDILVIGLANNGESAGYHFQGVIKRFGSIIGLVGTLTKQEYENDPAWDAQVGPDLAGGGALLIQVHGNGETIRWVAVVRTVEVSW